MGWTSRKNLFEAVHGTGKLAWTADAAIKGEGGEALAQLYKYNGNLLQLGNFACSELSLAARITACGKFWSARGNGKSASSNSLRP